jgi:hypothetical protein
MGIVTKNFEGQSMEEAPLHPGFQNMKAILLVQIVSVVPWAAHHHAASHQRGHPCLRTSSSF